MNLNVDVLGKNIHDSVDTVIRQIAVGHRVNYGITCFQIVQNCAGFLASTFQ